MKNDMKRKAKRFAGLAGAWFLILISQAASMAQSADEIAKAVLPLPEDLRAGAAIYVYDEHGDRKILRPGTNMVECMPKNPEDVCLPTESTSRRLDVTLKLAVVTIIEDLRRPARHRKFYRHAKLPKSSILPEPL